MSARVVGAPFARSAALRSAALVALAVLAAPRVARAVDPFEIQVYDGTANAPNVFGLEMHLNHVAAGLHDVAPPLLPTQGQTHFSFEPSLGVTRFWEIGGYFQTALLADGTLDFAGVKVRSKLVTPPGALGAFRLGMNFELGAIPYAFDADRVSLELRPIAAWQDRGWYVGVNPIVGVPLAGAGLRAGPSFEPCAAVVRDIAGTVGVGLEYYTGLGPIAHPSPLRAQEHYLYEVLELLAVADLELQIGVGEGLTDASNPLVVKAIVGYVFEPRSGVRVPAAPSANAGAGATRAPSMPSMQRW